MSTFPRFPSPPPTYDAPSAQIAATSSTLQPYLVLPHLLSLTWLAYPILSLLLVAFRLQLSLASSQDAVASAKDGLLASCKAAERAATSTASIPRYMALATNEQFVDAVNGTLRAARATLVLALTIMEVVINFIIDIYRSTFLCFLELIVRGALSILISAVQEFSNLVSAAANGISSALQSQIQNANSVIRTAIDAINKVNPFDDINVPQIPIPDLSALQNVQLPTDFQDALTKLNSSLPTVAELKDKVEDVVNLPFELLKKDINDTFAAISFNSSTMPVPQQNTVNFCSDLDLTIVDDLGRDLIRIAKIGTIVLILLGLLLIGLNCLLEWFKWVSMKRHLEYTRQAWVSDPTLYHSGPPAVTSHGAPNVTLSDHNLLMLQSNMSHPLLTRITNNMAARFRLSQVQHTHLQWFFHYIFHPPALACLIIGFVGLMSIQIQLIAIGAIETKYQSAAADTTSDFTNTIATSINDSMYAQSAAYAADVNLRVDGIQTTVNDGMFGWVNVTTTELNTTIVNFYAGVQDVVQTVFNGTILESPANEFIRCLIGTKVDAIENALTFLHDNLRVDLPRMNDSALVLSPASVDEAARPIALAAIGGSDGGNGDDRGLFGKVIDSYANGLRKERLMFAIFLILWGLVVLMALCVIFWHSYGKALVERRRRGRWQREQRSGFEGIVVPFRSNNAGNEKGGVQGQGQLAPGNQLPAFTPIPSPRPPGVFSPTLRSNNSSPRPGTVPKEKDAEKSWDSFFGETKQESKFSGMISSFASRTRARTISAPKKLMAIGKKPIPAEDRDNTDGPSFSDRIRGILAPAPRSRARPNLTISVDRASSIRPDGVGIDREESAPKSAWSASPTTPYEQNPRVTTPSAASVAIRPSLPWTRNIASPPPLPLRVMNPSIRSSSNGSVVSQRVEEDRPRHNANVPSDVTAASVHDLLSTRVQTPGLAPPLHYGYGNIDSRYPPLQPRGLMPPVDKHRRSMSVPVSAISDTEGATPVTKMLSTTHARKSSSVNPFEGTNPFEGATPSPGSESVQNPFDRSPMPNVNPFMTPFDDEHRVKISHAKTTDIRKSIPTNPFGAIAL
ncbi:Plasma membrane fusion protein PRM1 [Pleurotus pulmonarius]